MLLGPITISRKNLATNTHHTSDTCVEVPINFNYN